MVNFMLMSHFPPNFRKANWRYIFVRKGKPASPASGKARVYGICRMASASEPESSRSCAELPNPAQSKALIKALDTLQDYDKNRREKITETLTEAAKEAAEQDGVSAGQSAGGGSSLLSGFAELIHQNGNAPNNVHVMFANLLFHQCFRATASWLYQKCRAGSEFGQDEFRSIYGTFIVSDGTIEWLQEPKRSVDDVLVALMLPNKGFQELIRLGASAEQAGRFPSRMRKCMNRFQGSHAFVVGFAGSSCWLLLVFHCTHSLFLDKRMC